MATVRKMFFALLTIGFFLFTLCAIALSIPAAAVSGDLSDYDYDTGTIIISGQGTYNYDTLDGSDIVISPGILYNDDSSNTIIVPAPIHVPDNDCDGNNAGTGWMKQQFDELFGPGAGDFVYGDE